MEDKKDYYRKQLDEGRITLIEYLKLVDKLEGDNKIGYQDYPFNEEDSDDEQ